MAGVRRYCAEQDRELSSWTGIEYRKGMSLAFDVAGPTQAEVTYGFGLVVDVGILPGRVRGHAGHGDHGPGERSAEAGAGAYTGPSATPALELQKRQGTQSGEPQAPRGFFGCRPSGARAGIDRHHKLAPISHQFDLRQSGSDDP